MRPDVSNFIKVKRIDSIQKLQFLLFLSKNPHLKGSSQDLASLSYLGSESLVEQIICELLQVGLLEKQENSYQLSHCPDTRQKLQDLVTFFDDPLHRQQLIDYIRRQLTT